MKVIELLNKISKGENPDFKMNGGSYKNSVWSFINMYFGHKILTFEEIICWLNAEVEIIEDEEEPKMFEQEWFNSNEGTMSIVEVDLAVKINELINKVNSIEKELNK